MYSARANFRTERRKCSLTEFFGFSNDFQLAHGCSSSAAVRSIKECSVCCKGRVGVLRTVKKCFTIAQQMR